MNNPTAKPISIIVAVARNQAIGLNNQLLWHLPEDFRWFKKNTHGHPVIMGRRTWLSLPNKPLPGRKNIVITDTPDDCFPGSICVDSPDAAIQQMDQDQENFIIGGGMVYRLFLPEAQKVYLTLVDRDYEADTWFPALNPAEWKEVFREAHEGDPGYSFLIYQRIN